VRAFAYLLPKCKNFEQTRAEKLRDNFPTISFVTPDFPLLTLSLTYKTYDRVDGVILLSRLSFMGCK
jgi:hypothetical protein